jgi:UDP-galactopyranose mutase
VQGVYDFAIVGSGLFGAVCARELTDAGFSVWVIERRGHIGGNLYTSRRHGIDVHEYGPHIFHCSNAEIWDYVNRFARFAPFVNSPLSMAGGRLYSLPFNMHTFYQIWGVTKPALARAKIEADKPALDRAPENLEEQAIALVGQTIYERLVRGYTAKQWQRHPRDLPPEIIKRLPLRFTFDCNYFDDTYQGIPQDGYTALIERLLEGIPVTAGIDYLADRAAIEAQARYVIYTGALDEFFDYDEGVLAYRGLSFEHEVHDSDNVQGNAVINYADAEVPYTRTVEHRHFVPTHAARSIVTREYPAPWRKGDIPFYPINDRANNALHRRYESRLRALGRYYHGGRLADYRYYDMHQVVGAALKLARRIEREVAYPAA